MDQNKTYEILKGLNQTELFLDHNRIQLDRKVFEKSCTCLEI